MSLEYKAIQLSKDRARLLERLLAAREALNNNISPFFNKYTFDFDNKRLTCHNGKYRLQWLVREHPDQPVSENNQQTSEGVIVLHEVKEGIVEEIPVQKARAMLSPTGWIQVRDNNKEWPSNDGEWVVYKVNHTRYKRRKINPYY